MVIELKEIGRHVGTKFDGAYVREKTVCALQENKMVEFDFDGVISLSESFAKECFGKLVASDRELFTAKRITFKNMTPGIKIKVFSMIRDDLHMLTSYHCNYNF
jgi:hypothetical protein